MRVQANQMIFMHTKICVSPAEEKKIKKKFTEEMKTERNEKENAEYDPEFLIGNCNPIRRLPS